MTAPLQRHKTLDGRWLTAFDKAEASEHKCWLTERGFKVLSSNEPGKWYEITPQGCGWQCNCKAGQYNQPCRHKAKVIRRIEREPEVLSRTLRPLQAHSRLEEWYD